MPNRLISLSLMLLTGMVSIASADIRAGVRALFTRDMATIDFASVKIEVDRMIDSTIEPERALADIDEMVAAIRHMLPVNASSWDKVAAIRRYIYEAGAWNAHRPFQTTKNLISRIFKGLINRPLIVPKL